MLKTLLIFVIGLTPPLLSVWFMRQAESRSRERLRRAIEREIAVPLQSDRILPDVQSIGDISCQFNARSSYLRCAVNPAGPCQDCTQYKPRERSDRSQ